MPTPTFSFFFGILYYGIAGSFVDLFQNAITRLAVPMMAFINESITDQFKVQPSEFTVQIINTTIWNIPLAFSIIGMFFTLNYDRRTITSFLAIAASGLVIMSQGMKAFEILFIAVALHGLSSSMGVTESYRSHSKVFHTFFTDSTTVTTCLMCSLSSVLFNDEVYGTADMFHHPFVLFITLAGVFWVFAPRFSEQSSFNRSTEKKVSDLKIVHHEFMITEFRSSTFKHTFFNSLSDPSFRVSYYQALVLIIPFYFGYQTFATYNYNILLMRFGWSNSGANTFYLASYLLALPFAFVKPLLYNAIGRRSIIFIGYGFIFMTTVTFALGQWILEYVEEPSSFSVVFGGIAALGCGINLVTGARSAFMEIVPPSDDLNFIRIVLGTRYILPLIANYLFVILDPIFGFWIYLPILILQIACAYHAWFQIQNTNHNASFKCQKLLQNLQKSKLSITYGSVQKM